MDVIQVLDPATPEARPTFSAMGASRLGLSLAPSNLWDLATYNNHHKIIEYAGEPCNFPQSYFCLCPETPGPGEVKRLVQGHQLLDGRAMFNPGLINPIRELISLDQSFTNQVPQALSTSQKFPEMPERARVRQVGRTRKRLKSSG